MKKLIFAMCMLTMSVAHAEREMYRPSFLAPTTTAGTILFDRGSATAASIAFSGDPNTGMYSIQADEVAFVAGGTSIAALRTGGNFHIGNGILAASPSNGSVNGTGAVGTDIRGGTLTIRPGRGTGSGGSGFIYIQTCAPGSSGSTLCSMSNRLEITDLGTFNFYAGTQINASDGSMRLPRGATLPATCTQSEVFHDIDSDDCINTAGGDGALCICKTTNTWALVANF